MFFEIWPFYVLVHLLLTDILGGNIIIPIIQMRKQGHREVKILARCLAHSEARVMR